MPDAGDDIRHERTAPHDWSDALAALPTEIPPADGWARLSARLPAPQASSASPAPSRNPRLRWPLWLATAASLLLAVAIPLWMPPQGEGEAQDISTRHSGAGRSPALAVQASGQTQRLDPGFRRDDGRIDDGKMAAANAAAAAQSVATPIASRDKSRRSTRIPPSQRPIRTAARPAGETRIATTEASPATDLEPLYAQSAQLEALLAMARDERVASGIAAALSNELDARLAGIDALLIQPGLSEAQHAGLWGQRVDALRQLVGIEATNRLYAAHGQRYDAALVSID